MTHFDHNDGLSDPYADPADEWDRAYDATPHKNGETPTPAAMPKRKKVRRAIVTYWDGKASVALITSPLLNDAYRILPRSGYIIVTAEWPREAYLEVHEGCSTTNEYITTDETVDQIAKRLGLTK